MFHDWTGSLIIVLFVGVILTAFAILVSELLAWIWDSKEDAGETPAQREGQKQSLDKVALGGKMGSSR
jgi:hypothetical protein